MPTVVGAGAVGLALGARLARAGMRVRFVTRSAEAAARLKARGVTVEDPATSESWQVPVEAEAGLANACDDVPLLLCVRTPDVPALADEIASRRPDAVVASFQNGIGTEAMLASRLRHVIGGVWRQTCTRLDECRVCFTGVGRVIVGLHPRGRSPVVETLAARLRRAGFDTAVSERIDEDKWLKLCINLMSAPNALVRRQDHREPAFVEIKVRLLEEARRALRANGIEARSCDGRDRSLEEEIRFQRESLARGTSARPLPLYNQVWAALRSGATLEADGYHRLIVELARRAGVTAPANARVLRILEDAFARRAGPECVAAKELLGS